MKKNINNSQSIELVRAKSLQECKEAILCCISNFYPKGYKKRIVKLWKHKWFSDPNFKFSNLLLARKNGKIIGGLRTSSFSIKRLKQTYTCLSISEIFVDSKFRNLKIANSLIDFFISIAEKKKIDLLVASARRKIDGFYLKKNFYGIGSYPQLEFNDINVSKKIRGHSNSKTFRFKSCKFLPQFEKFYNTSYKDVFGRIVRDKKKWKFIIKSLENNNFSLLGIYKKKIIVGYLIYKKNNIYEISFKKNIDVKNLIYDLSDFLNFNNLIFFISPRHILLKKDNGFDISVKLRDCYYGGHVARIININTVIKKFVVREKKQLKKKIKKPISINLTKTLLGLTSQAPYLKRDPKNFFVEPFVFSKVDEFY